VKRSANLAPLLVAILPCLAGGCQRPAPAAPPPAAGAANPGGPLNPVDYGADPTGKADSTAAINKAIADAGSGGAVSFPPGTYKVGGTLNVTGLQGLRVLSYAGNNHGGKVGATLRWQGNATDPLWLLSGCRDCEFERITVAPATPLAAAWRLETRQGFTSTHNRFYHCYIQGGARTTSGWELVKGSAGDNNNDIHVWDGCLVANVTGQGWLIGHAQSVCNAMRDCTVSGTGAGGKSCGVNQQRGNFHWDGGSMTRLGTCFYLGNASYPVCVRDVGVEGCARLLDTVNAGVSEQVLLEGIRFTPDSLAADRGMVRWGFAGTLTCQSCLFGGGPNQPQIQSVLNLPALTSRVVVRGCQWNSPGSNAAVPFVQLGQGKCRARFEDNKYTDATGHGTTNLSWD
jgi:hypothetical protein